MNIYRYIAISITNEYISILKIRYTKLRHWLNGITPLYMKTLKQLMFDSNIKQEEEE